MRLRACLIAVLGMGMSALASAAAPKDTGDVDYVVRELTPVNPPAERRTPKFQLTSPPARWFSSIPWRYNGAGAPPLFRNASYAVAQLQRAFDAWSAVCGVRYVYEGETTTAPNHTVQMDGVEVPDLENVIGWAELGADSAGITHWWTLPTPDGTQILDADMTLDPGVYTVPLLQAIAKHEFGHMIGLRHSDREGMLMSGPPLSSYGPASEPRYDDIRGCRCLYGPPSGGQAGYACDAPSTVDLGAVQVGATSAPRAVTLRNNGNGVLAFSDRTLDAADVQVDAGCAPGTQLAPGARCTMILTATPMSAGSRSASLTLQGSDGPYVVDVRFAGATAPGTAAVDLVEYFHAGFAHFFATALPAEIAILDGGSLPGWARTGKTMRVWSSPQPSSSPACRFFSTRFEPKSSHFYTASPGECADVKGNADWRFEGEVFHVALPDGQGTCPAGTQPIYRLYNQGAGGAPNHRFTTETAVRATMLSQGWIPEGAGLGVTMCAPS